MNRQTASQVQQARSHPLLAGGILQRRCACGQHTIAGGECTGCAHKREEFLQHSATNNESAYGVPAIVPEVLGSPGQPLDSMMRSFMESRFSQNLDGVRTQSAPALTSAPALMSGPVYDSFEQEADRAAEAVMRKPETSNKPMRASRDFSLVRVHTGVRAAESARAVNARAYTFGHNIVFGAGQYATSTSTGRRLLAHELAHVLQQTSVSRQSVPNSFENTEIQRASVQLDSSPYIARSCYKGTCPTNSRCPDEPCDNSEKARCKWVAGDCCCVGSDKNTGCRTTMAIPCQDEGSHPKGLSLDASDLCNVGDCRLSIGGLNEAGERLDPHMVLAPGECASKLDLPAGAVSAGVLCWQCTVDGRPGRGALSYSYLCA